MEQCLHCSGYLFFKPLPDETFACCDRYGEKVEDIDLRKGVSPAIEEHCLKGIHCERFQKGESIFCTSPEKPFELHPVRKAGEEFLLRALGG